MAADEGQGAPAATARLPGASAGVRGAREAPGAASLRGAHPEGAAGVRAGGERGGDSVDALRRIWFGFTGFQPP